MKSLKSGFFTIIALFFFCPANAQTVQWAHSGTSQGYEYGNAITTDDSGNVYVSGQIEYTTHFDNGQSVATYGSHDIFAGKYGPDGTVKWLRGAGGRGGDVGYGVAADNQQNCFVTGEIEDTVRFSSSVSLISKGGNDIFLSKYNSNGSLLWAKNFGSTESDKGYSVITNSDGDVFLTGFYSAHIYFDNIHLTPYGRGDVYTMKLDNDGVVQWAKKGAGAEDDKGKGITFDRSGNIYVAGFFTDQATFSGTTINNNGTTGGFLVKYDANGQFQWVEGNCCGTSEYEGIAIDADDNIYTTGFFTGTVNIGNTTLTSSGSSDILIVKYDPAGNIIWAKKAGGPYEDIANGITVDSINEMFYITGQLDDHGYFDSKYAGAAGNKDVFIAAYDLNGNCQWVKPYGGVNRDIAYGISSDRNGNITTTGIYTGNVTIGNYFLAGNLLSDYYVQKVSPIPVSEPTVATTNLAAANSNCNDLLLNFTPGNGAGRIVIAHEGSVVHQLPVNGISYNANPSFGSGDNLGSGNYVVYKGSGDSVNVTSLTAGVVYYFSVFEYNGTGAVVSYMTNNPATASQSSGTYSVNIQSASNSICVGDTLTLTASGSGTYSWSPASGLSTTTGNVVQASPVSTTTYSVTATINGCDVQDIKTISVNQLPSVTLPGFNSVCGNSSPVSLSGGLPSGGVYSGSGVVSGNFDPAISGVGVVPVTYFYTDGNGCSDTAISPMNVLQSPVVTLSLINSICENSSPVVLTGGLPSGGVYSGNGITAGSFDPALTGSSTVPVLYSYTDVNGCSDSASSSIQINSAPIVSLGNDTTICDDRTITLDAGSGYSVYHWSTGSTQSSLIIDSTGTGLGVRVLFIEVENSFGCSATDTIQLTFSICTDVNNVISNSAINVYPNPFTHSLHLSLDKKSDIYIYDSTARLVEELLHVNGEIELGSSLAAGVYSVVVYQNDVRKAVRVIKSFGK
jgi:hypothetical protein